MAQSRLKFTNAQKAVIKKEPSDVIIGALLVAKHDAGHEVTDTRSGESHDHDPPGDARDGSFEIVFSYSPTDHVLLTPMPIQANKSHTKIRLWRAANKHTQLTVTIASENVVEGVLKTYTFTGAFRVVVELEARKLKKKQWEPFQKVTFREGTLTAEGGFDNQNLDPVKHQFAPAIGTTTKFVHRSLEDTQIRVIAVNVDDIRVVTGGTNRTTRFTIAPWHPEKTAPNPNNPT